MFTVKILNPTDDRAQHEDLKKEKSDEVHGITRRKIWVWVLESDVPSDANILGGRFILTLKNYETPQEKEKFRYVDQGFKEKDKP